MSALLAAGGGFLLAVLWMDLMFDVQALRRRGGDDPLPEEVLASIAGYYRRVTTTARPMSRAIGAVMILSVAGAAAQLALGAPLGRGLASLALCGAPVVLALLRVFPNAVRLGGRADPPRLQSALARGICRDHLLCLASIAAFVALQIWGALAPG